MLRDNRGLLTIVATRFGGEEDGIDRDKGPDAIKQGRTIPANFAPGARDRILLFMEQAGWH